MRRLAIATVLLVAASACSSTERADGPADGSTVIDRCDDIVELRKLREELTPAAGRRVTIRALGPNGEPVDADPASCLRTTSPGIDIAAGRVATDDPVVAVLVDPGSDPLEAAASRAAATDLLDQLAPDVDVAVFGLGPTDDAYSNPATITEPPTDWLIWRGAGPPPEMWDRIPLVLDDGFDAVATPIQAVPDARAAVPGPQFARTNLLLDEAVDPRGMLFTGTHTGGLVLRVGGTEVVRSNLPAGELSVATQPVEITDNPTRFSTTVPTERFVGRDNVVSIEWYGASTPDGSTEFALTAIDSRTRPIAAAPLTGFGHDRDFAIAQLRRRQPRSLAPLSLVPAVTEVAEHLDELRERSTDGPKVLVVVAPHRAPESLPEFGGDPIVVWVGDGSVPPPRGVHRSQAGRPGMGEDIAAFVEAHRVTGVWAVGLCGPAEPIEPVFEVAGTAARTSPKLAAPVGSGSCDPAAALAGAEAASAVRFGLTADQQRVFDQREVDADRRPMAATLRLAEGIEVEAELRIRGQSTLECGRKSYSVSLAAPTPIPLFDGWNPKEFTLLSLCLDEGYVRTLTTFRLLAALGVSDLRMSLVDLGVGDRELGVYLLVEHADDLVEHDPTAVGVVRRRLDRSIQTSEVEWAGNRRPDLLFAEYESVIAFAEGYDGDDLAGDLDEMMDLDQYLRWLALMSLLANGDYSDEAYFVGVPVAHDQQLGLRWRIEPWDPDDMFQPCHLDGVLEIDDRAELTNCAESRIDVALLEDTGVYERYVEQLGIVLDELTPDRFADVLESVRTDLDRVLPADPQRLMPELASFDPAATDPVGFVAALDRNDQALIDRFSTRHADLGQRRDAFAVGLLTPLDQAALDDLTILAPSHAPLGGPLPLVVEARAADGTIDRSVSGRADFVVDGGLLDLPPVEIRRGRGSVTATVTEVDASAVTLSLTASGAAATVEIDAATADVRSLEGDLTGDDLDWGPDETIRLTGRARVPAGSTLTIGSGTRVEVAPAADLDVAGSVESVGSPEDPIVFAPLDPDAAWGGILHFGGSGTYTDTWFVGGGGNDARAFGHSGSQPIVLAAPGSTVDFERAVFQDGVGKGPSGDHASVSMSDSLVTRLDTGGEFVDSDVSIEASWFLDFGDAYGGVDDDNDALYLARSEDASGGATVRAIVRESVFIGGADDGIDHNGIDVDLERLWIEGFAHECVAFSSGGRAELSDSVLTRCEQGIEVGYGSPTVAVDHVVVTANDVGLRYGDEYRLEYGGTLTIRNSIVVDNVADVRNFVNTLEGPVAGAVVFARTLVGAPDPSDGAVLTGSVVFTDQFLLDPTSAGVGDAEGGRDLGLLSAQPR